MSKRTFVAVDIDERTRSNLAQLRDRLDDSRCKINWVAPENLHVTLKFLGDVEDDLLPKVCDAVAKAAVQVPPMEFDVRGVEAIPSLQNLRMLWVGVRDTSGRLDAMFHKIEATLEPLGFPRENRPFSPHITLARVKSIPKNAAASIKKTFGEHLDQLTDAEFGFVSDDSVTIYVSELTPAGPIYFSAGKFGTKS